MKTLNITTVPNLLTLGRLFSFPIIIFLASFDTRGFGVAAALVFSIAAITDILDGYLARKTEQVSDFGKLIDPIADKILIASAMIMLVHLGRIPAWMVVLIISREFAVSGLRSYAATRNIVIEARFTGKLKTTLQSLAVIFLLVNYPLWGVPFGELGMALFIAALVTTLWSGYKYFADYFKSLVSANGE